MEKTSKKTTRLKVLIILLALTSPISTDMCLPALPTIAEEFNASYSATNLIIICFFFFMATSILVLGPLSDKFGRKPILLASLLLFSLSNLVCALSLNLGMLVVFRALSACGAGGMITSSTSLVKDSFEGRGRDKALALVQAFQVIGPLCAPVIGALLIMVSSWRLSFLLLALVGALGFDLAVIEKRIATKPENGSDTMLTTFERIPVIVRNKGFSILLLVAGLSQACFMAYLATSSYIYTAEFGTTETTYSLFFAGTALCAMIGPRVYVRLIDRFAPNKIYLVCVCVMIVSGAATFVFGRLSQWIFFLCFLWVPLANSASRPLATAILLKQHDGDTGTLSALINFGLYIVGLVGMLLGSLTWNSYILALGGIVVGIATFSLLVFVFLIRSSISVEGIRTVAG